MEKELELVGQTREIRTYKVGKTQRLRPSMQSITRDKPPVIKPEEMPEMTMRRILQVSNLQTSGDYGDIIGYLTTYQRKGEHRAWDEFRNKIPDTLLKTWGDILIECRRNGFIRPRAEGKKIIWYQILDNGSVRNGDLCTMCDRKCARREYVDSGEAKRDKVNNQDWKKKQEPCWMIEPDARP